VASRIARKYHRPTIVIGIDEDGTGKGSGRSIEGLSLVEALGRCAHHLGKFGGHEMAAGLTLREQDVHLFAEAFKTAARGLLSEQDLQPRLRLDHELALAEIDLNLLRWHEMLQPFGNGNPQPLFFAREVEPVAAPRVINDKHLILRVGQRSSHRRAIYFEGATTPLPAPPWDVAFRIRADNYGGGETLVEMQIEALRQSGPIE
jgi:single-stranded-DNA-specific exonuclease